MTRHCGKCGQPMHVFQAPFSVRRSSAVEMEHWTLCYQCDMALVYTGSGAATIIGPPRLMAILRSGDPR